VSIGLLSGGSQQLNQTTSLVATGTNDVFTFPNPPTGYVWSGTLSVTAPSASQLVPVGALMTANVGATSWGEWGGNSVFGPVQANQSQQLVVTAQGLTAGVTYLLNWIGSSDPAHVVQPLYPAANSTALTAQITGVPPGVIYPVTPLAGPFNVTAGVNARTLILQIIRTSVGGSLTYVIVTGNTTGFNYYQGPAYLEAGPPFAHTVVVPVIEIADSTYNIQVLTSAGTWTVEVWADNLQYEENVFYNGATQAVSAVGNFGVPVTIISGPVRLLTANVQGSSGGAADLMINGIPALSVTANGSLAMTFPANTILQPDSLFTIFQTLAGASKATVTYCYP